MKDNKIYTLKNGLKVIFCQDTSKHSTYAEIIIKYGAMNNEFILNDKKIHINDGMAHFIEHLLIEHNMYGNCNEFFHNNYVDSNGSTSIMHTRFYIKTVSNFLENLVKLIRIVNIPFFNKDDIEKTKPPIYEEIRREKDNNFKQFFFLENKSLFKSMNFNSVLGEIEEIENINYDMVKMCYDIFYQPKSQVIAIAGNVDIKKTIELIQNLYDEIDKKEIEYEIPIINEDDTVCNKESVIFKNVEENFIRISYKINISSLAPFERVKLTFYIDYFLKYNFSEFSLAYKKLVENKISVNNIGYSYNIVNNYLIIDIDTYTNKENEFIKLIQETMNKKGMNFDAFEINRKKSIITMILREENFMKMVHPFIDNVITFNYYDIDRIEDIENQNYNDFTTTINSLNFDNYCITKMLKDN